jgi:hypothetical protein
MFSITVWDEDYDHGVIVDLAAGSGTPEHRARHMADFLMTTPQADWPTTRPIPANHPNPA